MSKVKPTTKEQLIHYLLSHISLGTYDRRFLSNLESSFLGKGKSVTTNQASLLDKIITRYARQLSKSELNYEELLKLEWNRPLIQSAPEYITAFAQLTDDKIIVRTPYKSGFIKELRAIRTAKWLKDEREWHINYNEPNLKSVVTLIADHYESINFCETIKGFLAEAEQFESVKVWNPTLYKINDNFIIAGITEPLYEAINSLHIENTPKCFSELASHGVDIDKELLTSELLEFAGSRTPKIEKSELFKLEEYLPAIGCENIVVASSVTQMSGDAYKNLFKTLEQKNIRVCTKGKLDNKSLANYVVLYSLRVATTDLETHANKMIQVINSEPVVIK